jgi:hypothetical protein
MGIAEHRPELARERDSARDYVVLPDVDIGGLEGGLEAVLAEGRWRGGAYRGFIGRGARCGVRHGEVNGRGRGFFRGLCVPSAFRVDRSGITPGAAGTGRRKSQPPQMQMVGEASPVNDK